MLKREDSAAESERMQHETAISEDRYRYLGEQSGDMISTHRPGDWAYTAINPAVLAVSGYSPEDLLGKPAYDFFHPDDAEAMKRKHLPAIYRNGVRTFRYRHRCKSGEYYWLEATHRSIRDSATGELKEIIAVSRDISPQMEAETASRRLAQVVQASSDLILFCNQDLAVSYMNASAQQGFGLQQFAEGLKLADLLSVESLAAVQALLGTDRGDGSIWRGELQLHSPRFEQRFITLQEVLMQSQPSIEGSSDYYTLIIRDQTEQKNAEAEVQQQQAMLAHSARLMTMGEMATGIAHEINQPLATGLNYAQGALRQIKSGRLSTAEDLRPVLDNIARQTRRAASIVKRMRALVRKTPYQRHLFDVRPLCLELQELMQHDLRAQNIALILRLHTDALHLEADRVQIEQVLVNLLRNAIEAYRGVEDADKQIVLETAAIENNLQFTITDFGVGIEPELKKLLFEPYASTKQDGLGMGLSISRTIVEAHGGAIDVISESGSDSHSHRGQACTRFRVSLPLADSADNEEPADRP